MKAAHHPAIEALPPYEGPAPVGGDADYYGVMYSPRLKMDPQKSYGNSNDNELISSFTYESRQTDYPGFNEEYFEHIDLIESIRTAKDRYVMFELGSNYGRWGLRAFKYLQRCGIKDFELVFIEGEPLHFRDLHHHLKLNKVPMNKAKCFEALVTGSMGNAPLAVTRPQNPHPRQWRGQGLQRHVTLETLKEPRFTAQPYFDKTMLFDAKKQEGFLVVPTITLTSLLQPYSCVDLIDMDIQGAEADVVEESIDELNARVRRLHIGTHSREIEARLRAILGQQGWLGAYDFPNHSINETPYGALDFCDGVQSWINPRLTEA
jgi:FkbM family methyltransferase